MFCAFFFSLGKFYIDKMANGKNVQREIKKTKSPFFKNFFTNMHTLQKIIEKRQNSIFSKLLQKIIQK